MIAFLWVFAALSCIPDFMANTIDANPLSTYLCTRPWSLDEYFDRKGYIIFSSVSFGIFSLLSPVILKYFVEYLLQIQFLLPREAQKGKHWNTSAQRGNFLSC